MSKLIRRYSTHTILVITPGCSLKNAALQQSGHAHGREQSLAVLLSLPSKSIALWCSIRHAFHARHSCTFVCTTFSGLALPEEVALKVSPGMKGARGSQQQKQSKKKGARRIRLWWKSYGNHDKGEWMNTASLRSCANLFWILMHGMVLFCNYALLAR